MRATIPWKLRQRKPPRASTSPSVPGSADACCYRAATDTLAAAAAAVTATGTTLTELYGIGDLLDE
jgi:hypothetical protein